MIIACTPLLLARSLSFYAGALLYTLLLKHAGGVAAVAVGTVRKSLTVLISFVFFPKPWSGSYGWGSALMLAAIALDQRAHRGGSDNATAQRGAKRGVAGSHAADAGRGMLMGLSARETEREEREPCVAREHDAN